MIAILEPPMSRLAALCATGLLVACDPPDPAVGPEDPGIPEIRLIYPTAKDAPEYRLDENGRLDLFVVVDIIDLEFVAPSITEELDPIDGQGHWHLLANGNDYIDSPGALYAETSTDKYSTGSASLLVDLHENDHSELAADPCVCSATFEFQVLPFDGTSSGDAARETPDQVLERLEREGHDIGGMAVVRAER